MSLGQHKKCIVLHLTHLLVAYEMELLIDKQLN